MLWVIDASVAVRWFLEEEAHPNADRVLSMVVDSPESFAVPELFAFEVFSVLETGNWDNGPILKRNTLVIP